MEAGAQPGRVVSQRWIFTVTVAFLYAAAVLRSILEFDGQRRVLALALLAVWLMLFLTEPLLSRRWHRYFGVYLALQAVAIGALLTLSDSSDFFAILLAVPSMQAMQRWPVKRAAALLGLFAILIGLCLTNQYGPVQSVAFAAIYTGANVFMATFALAAKHATAARLENDSLAADLRHANRQLADYAARTERLAGARERQRLARDLHDSVTQTLFSMTLTTRSAALLLRQSPEQVAVQLDQIDHLTRGALSEMSTLSAELPRPSPADVGLPASLRHHLAERARRDGLDVSLEVQGDDPLPAGDEAALLRIVQEALNNVVKHAGTSRAVVRVCLRHPCRVEIEDQGDGFDPDRVDARGLGLNGMRERAGEIGWTLAVRSAPGEGTHVVAEETSSTEGHGHASD
jgi:signal transduction histidine kinase